MDTRITRPVQAGCNVQSVARVYNIPNWYVDIYKENIIMMTVTSVPLFRFRTVDGESMTPCATKQKAISACVRLFRKNENATVESFDANSMQWLFDAEATAKAKSKYVKKSSSDSEVRMLLNRLSEESRAIRAIYGQHDEHLVSYATTLNAVIVQLGLTDTMIDLMNEE